MNRNSKTLHSRPTYTPKHLLPASLAISTRPFRGTLTRAVVVVIEATRTSITKPHGQASPQEGVLGTQTPDKAQARGSPGTVGLWLPTDTYYGSCSITKVAWAGWLLIS